MRVVIGITLLFLLSACSSEDKNADNDQGTNGKTPAALAEEAASINKKTISNMVELLQSGSATIDNVDSLYDASKSELLKYGKLAAKMPKNDYASYAQNYQVMAYEGNDSLMLIISHYRDSIIQSDPGDVLALELQSYLSLGVFADPEMTRRVFPSEYELIYSK